MIRLWESSLCIAPLQAWVDKQIVIELVPSKSGLIFFAMPSEMAAEYIFMLTPIILQFLIFHTYCLSDFKIQEIANYLCVRNCLEDLQIYQWKTERNEQDFVWLHASFLPVTYILIGKLMLLLKKGMFWKTLLVKNPSQKLWLSLSCRSKDAHISWNQCFGGRGI